MAAQKPLSPALIDSVARLMAPLGEPARIALLQALREGAEANIQELADEVEIPHKHASHHLIVLHRAGLIVRRKAGREVFYSLDDWTAWWLIEKAAGVFAEDDDG